MSRLVFFSFSAAIALGPACCSQRLPLLFFLLFFLLRRSLFVCCNSDAVCLVQQQRQEHQPKPHLIRPGGSDKLLVVMIIRADIFW